MINVWVTEKNKDPYCLVERAVDREEAIDSLEEAILDHGVVPPWIISVKFYGDGDFPIETY